jgi:hypothetical protein
MPRPSFKATTEQRKTVKSMAAVGLTHEQIATAIGIRSPKTLRKHFRKELTIGAAEATASVSAAALQMALSGKYPEVTKFWLNNVGDPGDEEFEGGEDSAWHHR